MKRKLGLVLAAILYFAAVDFAGAEDLGPLFKKIKDGIYVYSCQPLDIHGPVNAGF